MQGSRFELTNVDAVTWLQTLPSDSIDLVVTDPPYESLEKHRAIGTTTRLKHSKASSNDWFAIFPNSRFEDLFAEIYRVLKRDRHFYLYCDPETMFVAKPIGEKVGFKFWKPIIWDKCLGPDTLVWTERGVVPISEIVVGDHVANPEGGSTRVRGTRRTRASSLQLKLSDGTEILTSRDHRFVRGDGVQLEANALRVGDSLCTRRVRQHGKATLDLDDVIPEDEIVFELPSTDHCPWCGEHFDNVRAASAHQARFCEGALSKIAMAEALGITTKRLQRWMARGALPRSWAAKLGLEGKLGARVRCYLQDDIEVRFPRTVPLDYELGKLIGLYAAEGSPAQCGVSFALHASEKHLQNHIARFARSLGIRAHLRIDDNSAVVDVNFKLMSHLIDHFVGGETARTKFLKPTVYAAPEQFRKGVFDGLNDGDSHWSHDEQHETYVSAASDLAMFVRRELEANGRAPTISRFENDHAGGWRVRHDPANRVEPLTITAIEDAGVQDLVDISVDAPDELFLLANGVVTHNCRIGMGYHYRARYECILFFEKGKRKLNDLGVADVLEHPRVVGGYPAEKPPKISETLITQSTQPGEIVIDPFMGSGSVGVAAVGTGRHFRGNDLCEEAVTITRGRLREAGADEAPIGGDPILVPGQLGLTI